MFGFTKDELRILKSLSTPKKIQDYLNTLSFNFEQDGETCMSPRRVMREKRAHCIEGAMLAAAALRVHGEKPLVMDLRSTKKDFDHVVTLFKSNGCCGAISKTNHGVLRYREPIYKTLRELALSYFHEYFLKDGTKTLRSYSVPVDLSRFDDEEWMTSEEDVWIVANSIDDARHHPLLSKAQVAGLRKADAVERAAGELTEWNIDGKAL